MTDLPRGWAEARLADVCDIEMGQSPPSSTYNTDGSGLPFLQGKGEFGKLHPTPAKFCSCPSKIAKAGAILLSVRAPVGPTNITPTECCIGRGLAAISPLGDIPDRFVLWALRCHERALAKSGTGSTFAAVSKAQVVSIPIVLPPLNEQRRIVERIEALFDEIDRGVQSLYDAKRAIGLYRQALLKSAFEGRITADWRTENPDKVESPEVLLNRVREMRERRHGAAEKEWERRGAKWRAKHEQRKEPKRPRRVSGLLDVPPEEVDRLPQLPREWRYTKLANLGELSRGRSKHRPRNDRQLFGGPYPFIQTAEVKAAGRSITEYRETYSDAGLAQSKLWPAGTLCITIAANIAETAFLTFEACFPDSVVGFSAFEEIVTPAFVELFIKSTRSKIEEYAPATAQKNINLATLDALAIPFCGTAEQAEVVRVLDERLDSAEMLQAEVDINLARAEALCQSILERAFSGKLVPQDPNDEPARALLARIRAGRDDVSTNKPRKSARRRAHAAAPP